MPPARCFEDASGRLAKSRSNSLSRPAVNHWLLTRSKAPSGRFTYLNCPPSKALRMAGNDLSKAAISAAVRQFQTPGQSNLPRSSPCMARNAKRSARFQMTCDPCQGRHGNGVIFRWCRSAQPPADRCQTSGLKAIASLYFDILWRRLPACAASGLQARCIQR